MRKLSVFLFVLCVLVTENVLVAQSVRVDQAFGLGVTTSNISGKTRAVNTFSVADVDYTLRLRQFGIVYGARVDLVSWKFGSVSIGSPIMLGLGKTSLYRSIDFNGVKKDTIEGLQGTQFALELPLFADVNIGLHSAADASMDHYFGIYVGAGYMYSYTNLRTSAGNIIYDGFDPCLRAGIRMGNAWERRFSIGFTIRGDLKNNGSTRTYGIQLLKEL